VVGADDTEGAIQRPTAAQAEPPRDRAPIVRTYLLGLLSVADLGAFIVWLGHPRLLSGLFGWLILRAVICGLAVVAVWVTASGGPDRRSPRWLLATAVWTLALPIFGAAIASIAASGPGAAVKDDGDLDWHRWALPARWDDPALKIAPPARTEAPEAVAGDLTMTDHEHDGRRLHALLRAARLPLRFQVPLARGALSDGNDDVRLYAFSLIDRRLREHDRAVQASRAALDLATTPEARGRAHLHLAEVVWEGVYHALYEGSILHETLVSALDEVDQALLLSPDDAAAHALRGRILLRMGRPEVAEAALRRALELGAPAIKLLPQLAEGAFQQRQFGEVQGYLARIDSLEAGRGKVEGKLRRVMECWL